MFSIRRSLRRSLLSHVYDIKIEWNWTNYEKKVNVWQLMSSNFGIIYMNSICTDITIISVACNFRFIARSCSNCFLCLNFYSHTVEHSPVGCTSAIISGQAIRFIMSERWLSATSCNYVVARWTTIRENYGNGKLYFISLCHPHNWELNRMEDIQYHTVRSMCSWPCLLNAATKQHKTIVRKLYTLNCSRFCYVSSRFIPSFAVFKSTSYLSLFWSTQKKRLLS